MKQLQGKYCQDCKIFTDNIEEEAVALVQSMLEQPAFADSHIRIMPDVHMGKGITIGFSAPLGKYVNPNHVGVDIGCTVSTMELSTVVPAECYADFERMVGEVIPTGHRINDHEVINRDEFFAFLNEEYKQVLNDFPEMINPVEVINEEFVSRFLMRIGMNTEMFYCSLPSLGGGNHFLEYGETEDGRGFFTVHCGSRNLGVRVCSYWVRKAKDSCSEISEKDHYRIIEEVKASCPDRTQWQRLIQEAKVRVREEEYLADYLSGAYLKGYLSDMVITQAYARFNHIMIHRQVSQILQEHFGISVVNEIYTTHNYIDFKDHPMLRKGAIRAYADELCIIPFNMRDGLAICRGKSNSDWNFTAPHGAGRILSRTAAKMQLKMEDFERTMTNVYSTTVCEGTLDESPMAYKPMDEIVRLIEPTVEILYFVRPKINIKATDAE
ncbi:MAG: RtcB family protein [Bacteroidales bacterium]|nr:RtcB family protein [Bacteroidales bacterium]